MCDPATIMAIVAGVAKASEIGQTNRDAADAQTAEAEALRATQKMGIAEEEDIKGKTEMDLAQLTREKKREASTARVMGAESGVAGASPFKNIANVYMQEGLIQGSVISLSESDVLNVAMQADMDWLNTKGQIQGLERNKKGGLAAALSIGAAAAGGYQQGETYASKSAPKSSAYDKDYAEGHKRGLQIYGN